MNKILPFLIILILATPLIADSNDAVTQAKALFSQGKYIDGGNMLNNAMRDKSLTSLQRNQLIYSLGDFNNEYVGDFKTAIKLFGRVAKSDLADDQDIKIKAKEKIAAIEELMLKFSAQDKIYKKISNQSFQQIPIEQTQELILQLNKLALQNPDYYKIAHVHFFIGHNQEKVKNYGLAYKSFQKAVSIKPALGFYLPVSRMDFVLAKWRRQIANTTTWAVAGILLVIIAMSYYLSKPWKWIRFKHVIGGVVMLALWWGVFNISHIWLASRYVVPHDINSNPGADPEYPSATPGSYGGEIAGCLFVYGLVGVAGLYVFALGTSRLKSRWLVVCLNGIIGLFILSTMTTIFYLRHCDGKYETISNDREGLMYYVASDMYFRTNEPEASFLTTPKAFPNPMINNSPEDLKQWLLLHGKFDDPPKVEGGTK
jgi:tetratricopeptide (TPR) repeat protein